MLSKVPSRVDHLRAPKHINRHADTKKPSHTYLTTSCCSISVVKTPLIPQTNKTMPTATTKDIKYVNIVFFTDTALFYAFNIS